MPTLCVLRHAKSGWGTGAADHDRPLSRRGRAAAPLVGRWLRAHGYRPALVLCSSARRAVETLRALGDLGEPEIRVTRDLYLAAASEWLQRLRALPDGVSPVLAIGHNPGLQQLVADLAPASGEVARIAYTFPTAAMAVLELDGPWSGLASGQARLAGVVRPRELA